MVLFVLIFGMITGIIVDEFSRAIVRSIEETKKQKILRGRHGNQKD